MLIICWSIDESSCVEMTEAGAECLEVAPRQVGKKRAMGPQENAMKKKKHPEKMTFWGVVSLGGQSLIWLPELWTRGFRLSGTADLHRGQHGFPTNDGNLWKDVKKLQNTGINQGIAESHENWLT